MSESELCGLSGRSDARPSKCPDARPRRKRKVSAAKLATGSLEFIYGGRACVAWQRWGPLLTGTTAGFRQVSTTKSRTSARSVVHATANCSIGGVEPRSRPTVRRSSSQSPQSGAAKNAAMQARAYPARLPGSGPLSGLVGTGRGGLFPWRAPAGRGSATSVCAVDGASIAAAADAPLPPAQVTWQIVVGAVGRSVYLFPRSSELRIASSTSSVV